MEGVEGDLTILSSLFLDTVSLGGIAEPQLLQQLLLQLLLLLLFSPSTARCINYRSRRQHSCWMS